jgi:hypothetical protein
VPLAALLEEVGASWQGDIRVVRLLVEHGPRDHDRPVVVGVCELGSHIRPAF